jgi:hypothetical protein
MLSKLPCSNKEGHGLIPYQAYLAGDTVRMAKFSLGR